MLQKDKIMKTIRNIFAGVAALLAVAVLPSSCTSEPEYTPAAPETGAGVFFPSTLAASYTVKEGQTEILIPVSRNDKSAALTVALDVAVDAEGEEIFTIPSSVAFGAGEASAELEVAFDFEALVPDTKYGITLTLADAANTTQYGISSYSFTVAYPSPRVWEPAGTATMAEDVFGGEGEVEIEHEVGTNNYRIARVYWQIWDGDPDFENCDDLEFTLDANFEPVSIPCGFIDTGYDGAFSDPGNLTFYYQNTAEENAAWAGYYNNGYFSFTRSSYTYIIDGIFCCGEEPWNIFEWTIKWHTNPLDSNWETRFVPNYNADYDYAPIFGKGVYNTSTSLFGADHAQALQWAEEDGIIYLPSLFEEGNGLAFLLEFEKEVDEEGEVVSAELTGISIPDDQPLVTIMGKQLLTRKSKVTAYDLDAEAGTVSLAFTLKLADESGAAFGEYEESYSFRRIIADVKDFYGSYECHFTDGSKGVQNSFSGVEIAEAEDWLKEYGYDVMITGLLPYSYTGTTDAVPAVYDASANIIVIGQEYFGDALLSSGGVLYDTLFLPLDLNAGYFVDEVALSLEEDGTLTFGPSYTSASPSRKPDGYAVYIENPDDEEDAGPVLLLTEVSLVPATAKTSLSAAPALTGAAAPKLSPTKKFFGKTAPKKLMR